MKVLITGGAGYIGAITNDYLKKQDYETVVFDSLKNGHREAIAGTKLVVGDLTIKSDIDEVFKADTFDAVIHFAALALAPESMEKPFEYYQNNVLGSLNLLESMRNAGCKNLVFSSTCAVYGYPKKLPVTEDEKIAPESVYGSSKRIVEEIIEWYGQVYGLKYMNLRYFNAAGAALDGTLGENHAVETHIIPILLDVISGTRKVFELYGKDYPTPDGTCIRDYIHVVDLARAHVAALKGQSGSVNLGVGKGYSNLEVISVVEKVTGKKVPVEVKSRRPGDPASIYADNTKAKKLLGWEPKHSDLETIVESAWKYHEKRILDENRD
ncbi:UDP-glucose 4-epimerase GalE [Candidatus Gottesmanbacteria bacterium RIFCSPLOWO2_01_FULL_43_11b]|uniref:UDP-glucose 4-epimerase n=1 Tax=Candidatus Gottesmanbacteria bacterium RIFCSPLOWO2_01_FULL_43_11b TaxID=1798392 RepID=A0A1F6AIJ7_9BACT|nr:MAG: UDP-glucose 4-epimerase GalE [Candidatus Gottesmanbacteria bacterium RIFCSPLOWO2_01_FULL_43_11b]